MQSDIFTIILRLTPSKPLMETLPPEILHTFKQMVRSDPGLNDAVFAFLQQRAKSPSIQVKLLTFQLLNYLFCRSCHFRSIFCKSHIVPFLECFTNDLPPEKTAETLQSLVKIAIKEWRIKYGNIYKQLIILEKIIRPRITREQKIKIKQAAHMNDLIDVVKLRYTIFFKEMNNIIDLMDQNKCDFVIASDEYQQIVINQINERKSQILECEKDINLLKMLLLQYHLDDDVKEKVQALSDQFTYIEESVRQIGLYDDEFEDLPPSDEEFDE